MESISPKTISVPLLILSLLRRETCHQGERAEIQTPNEIVLDSIANPGLPLHSSTLYLPRFVGMVIV